MPDMKVCRSCKRPKKLSKDNWQPNNNSKDGYIHTCRACCKQIALVKSYTKVKIKVLADSLGEEQEKNEALSLKCEIAEKKCVELTRRNEMLEQDLKDAGKWPVKG